MEVTCQVWSPGQGWGLAGWSCGGDLKGFGDTRLRYVSSSKPEWKLPPPTGSEHTGLAYPAETQPALHGTLGQNELHITGFKQNRKMLTQKSLSKSLTNYCVILNCDIEIMM